MKKISILIPCYNEEKSLPFLYAEIAKVMQSDCYQWEILFVNDGSRDSTLEMIKSLQQHDKRVCYVDLSRNFGKESAMLAGMDYVTGDCVVIMDADLQDPPNLILEMLQYWEQGYQDVYARRITRGKESWLRQKFSLMFYWILSSTSNIDVLQNVGDFRLLDKCCIEALRKLRETERYTKGLFAWIGFNKKEITFERGDRQQGVSAWNFRSLLRLAMQGITSFTIVPLKISIIFGLLVAFAAFAYMIFVLVKAIFYGDPVQGYPTLIIIILFLGGVQLLSLGIIGEYLGRVFNETKNRPVYFVKEYKNESEK